MNMLEALQWAKRTGGWVRCTGWVPGVYVRLASPEEFGKHLEWWVMFSVNDKGIRSAPLFYQELDKLWETFLPEDPDAADRPKR